MAKTRIDGQPILDARLLAVFSYLSFFCIIPLVLKQNRAFVEQHGKQGLVLFVAQVSAFVGHIVVGSWFLGLSGLILGGYAIIGIIKVIQGEPAKLWLVSDIAEKITL